MSVEKVKVEVELPKGLVDFLRDIGNLVGNEKYAEEHIEHIVVSTIKTDMGSFVANPFLEDEKERIEQKYGVNEW